MYRFLRSVNREKIALPFSRTSEQVQGLKFNSYNRSREIKNAGKNSQFESAKYQQIQLHFQER